MAKAKLIAGIAGAAMMAGMSMPASAATLFNFSVSSFDLHGAGDGDGLEVYANTIGSNSFGFTLDPGSSTGWFDLFKIGTEETTVNSGEDTVAKPFTVDLDFADPSGASPNGITGSTTGFIQLFTSCGLIAGGCGKVTWDNPAELTFGNGGKFLVSLSDETFHTPGSSKVQAKFKLISDSAAIPEPSTWAMMILGLGVAGAAMRRRQRQTVRYSFA